MLTTTTFSLHELKHSVWLITCCAHCRAHVTSLQSIKAKERENYHYLSSIQHISSNQIGLLLIHLKQYLMHSFGAFRGNSGAKSTKKNNAKSTSAMHTISRLSCWMKLEVHLYSLHFKIKVMFQKICKLKVIFRNSSTKLRAFHSSH